MPPKTKSLMIAFLVLLSGLAPSAPAMAAERVYFIAIDETDWDYAPLGRDHTMGRPFDEAQRVFVGEGSERIGRTYRKAVFREYTDATFTTPRQRADEWRHLGLLGPAIHAEVGDAIRVVLKNNASRPYSLHPHGVFYAKDSEGAPYNDGTNGPEKADDAVPPGGTHTYVWPVPERAGPGPQDPSSIGWVYHSHTDAPRDVNSGLIGPIIITAAGKANPDGTPTDVDREFVTLFMIFDENESWYLDANIERLTEPGAVEPEREEFVESNLMHSINGYVFGNLPGLAMKPCERVR